MEVGRDDIVDSVVRLINGVGRSPYLFVGSGFPVDTWVPTIGLAC